MRYAPDHKDRTRARIVREAGLLFRRHGYRGVGVEKIMSAARLTRGGFYAHFRSKAALFSAVLDQPTDFVARLQAARSSAAAPGVEGACEVIAAYLDPANREKVARGCTLATLTQDVAREGSDAKKAYTRKVKELTHEFEQHLPASLSAAQKRERAQAAVTLCVGAIAIARSVADEALARQILESARERACATLLEGDSTRRN